MFGGFQTGAFQPAYQQVPGSTDAGRPRRVREIYRVRIDGQVFEFRTLDEALRFLEKAKAAAQQIAAKAVREASEVQKQTAVPAQPKPLPVPKIEISSRELRSAANATRREIEVIYEAAIRDAEIAMLMELNKRVEDDDDAMMLLM